jgi:hypothetical protein
MKARFVFLLVLAMMLSLPTVSAQQDSSGFDMYVASVGWQPGRLVWVNITGPANMTISIRITNTEGDIMAGRDTQLNETGKYSYEWSPSQEGEYNATVTFAQGLVLKRTFTIQSRVTPADLGEVYLAIFDLQKRFIAEMAELRMLLYVALGLGLIASVLGGYSAVHTRRQFSRVESEFEGFMKEKVASAIERLAKKKG